MQKVIREGKVAVLYSPFLGAGWSTWNEGYEELFIFHPILVDLVEKGDFATLCSEDKIKELLNIPKEEHICVLGADGLEIEWIKQGTLFYIKEYDGSEAIKIEDNDFIRA